MEGVVTNWNAGSGFGWIRSLKEDNREPKLFVHINDVHKQERLYVGDIVEFTETIAPKGRRAIRVKYLRPEPKDN